MSSPILLPGEKNMSLFFTKGLYQEWSIQCRWKLDRSMLETPTDGRTA